MPNSCWLVGWWFMVFMQRSNHLWVLAVACLAYWREAPGGTEWSKAMMISAPMSIWDWVADSGDKNWEEPSIWDLNSTPASVILGFRLWTWKPPESVRMGCGQFINLWMPPSFLTLAEPGRK